jgi:hypothetical protein
MSLNPETQEQKGRFLTVLQTNKPFR